MKTLDAINFFGSTETLNAALQLQNRKMPWGEHPPLERQYQIEVITNGVLKAERPPMAQLAYQGAERRLKQRFANQAGQNNQERPAA